MQFTMYSFELVAFYMLHGNNFEKNILFQNSMTCLQGYIIDAGIVDNIEVDPATGHIWLAVHPIPHQMIDHLKNPSKAAPSQVKFVIDIYQVYSIFCSICLIIFCHTQLFAAGRLGWGGGNI